MADEVEVQDAQADSSPADQQQGQPTPPAAPQPVQSGPPKEGQWVPYERLQTVSHQNQELRAAYAQMQGRVQQLEALQQKANQQGGQLSQQDQQTYQQAWTAIEQIFMASPRGQKLMQLADRADQVDGMQTSLKEMREAQLHGLEQQGINRIVTFAKDVGWSQDPEALNDLIERTEQRILKMDKGRQRFIAGDLTVFDEALQTIKERDDKRIEAAKRQQAQQLLDTKNKTRNLPPASRGSAAGPPGLPKMNPDNPQAYASELHKIAANYLSGSGS